MSEFRQERETIRLFLEGYIERNGDFTERIGEGVGVPLESPGLGVMMVVPDPAVEGGLLAHFTTDDILEPSDDPIVLAIVEECYEAMRERHPEVASIPLRTAIARN